MHGRFQPGSEPSELQTEGTLFRLGIQTYHCEQLGGSGEKQWWSWLLLFGRTASTNCNCWWVWMWEIKQSHAWNRQFQGLKMARVSSYQCKCSPSEECRGTEAWQLGPSPRKRYCEMYHHILCMEMSWQIQSLPRIVLLTHLQPQANVFHTSIESVLMILQVFFWCDCPQALWGPLGRSACKFQKQRVTTKDYSHRPVETGDKNFLLIASLFDGSKAGKHSWVAWIDSKI